MLYMLPHYVGEDTVEEEEKDETQVSCGKPDKSFFFEMNHDECIKNKKI